MKNRTWSQKHVWRQCVAMAFISTLIFVSAKPGTAQTTATWAGGAGSWSPCPPGGNAQWDTCNDNPPQFPDGNFNAVIDGGPVTATSASIVNLAIGSGASLVFPPNQPAILDITGSSMVNNGSISIAGSDGLQIIGPTTVTLSGSGSVSMAGSNFTGSGNPTLILQQPVQGQGSFGLGLNITNQSLINATGGTLNVQPDSVTNTGTMEASSGATLVFPNGVATAFNNTGGIIQALNGGTVQLDNGVYTGGTLTTSGSGVIQANSAAVLNGLTNKGVVEINYATLEGAINNIGKIEVPSATLFMSGNVTLSGSGTLILSGTGSLTQLDGTDTLTNQQLIHGSGRIYEVPLTNQGTIAADSSGSTLAIAGGLTTNTATLKASGGGALELDTVVNNSGGTIEALSGSSVLLTAGFNGSVNGGTLTTSGSGVVQSENGTLDGTVNVPTNAGLLTANNFNLYLQGTINNTGTIAISGNSCVVLNQPTTLMGTGKLTMASTTCIYGSGNAFVNQSTIQGTGSIGDSNPMPITNSGTIIANQTSPLVIEPNTAGFTNKGKLIVQPGSTLTINGLFNNLSTAGTLSGGLYNVTGVLALENSIVTNSANISLTGSAAEILNTGNSANALATLAVNNTTGVLALQSGQVLSTSTNLKNGGKITVGTGSGLTVGGRYTQLAGTTSVDGTLSAQTGISLQKGILLGQGSVAAIASSGTVIAGDSTSKPGKLSVTGSYTENASGVLDVAIEGTQAGTQYSQLAVANGVSLNGTLNINLINGFVPAIGDLFTIVTGSAVSGQFATVNGLTINSGEHFEVGYTANSVTLTVVSGS